MKKYFAATLVLIALFAVLCALALTRTVMPMAALRPMSQKAAPAYQTNALPIIKGSYTPAVKQEAKPHGTDCALKCG
jgi:hypothetical protein